MSVNVSYPLQRWKRKTLEESDAYLEELKAKSQKCKNMEIASISAGMAADLAGDAATAASVVPIVGAPWAQGFAATAAVAHGVKGGLDIARVSMDCSSVPFEEIKEIMDRRFNEVNRKLDENAAALAHISDKVSKTLSVVESIRYQMAEGFKNVLYSIKESRVEPIITQIHNFAEFFEGEKKRLGHLKRQDFVFSLQQHNYLNYLRDSRTPKGDSLQTSIFAIIKQGFALPKHSEDELALHALFALYYGTQTFVEVMYFLIDKYRYLADYNYEKGNLNEFNNYFLLLKLTIHDFKHSFIGFSGTGGTLNAVINLLRVANEKDLDGKKEAELKNQIDTLMSTKQNLTLLNVPLIMDAPDNSIGITFKSILNQATRGAKGKCDDAVEIKYAVQYERDGLYSPISNWLGPVTVRKNRKAVLNLPNDRNNWNKRLIFRTLNDQQSQLIKIIDNRATTIVDYDRDLYNAAMTYDQKFAMREMDTLLTVGSDVNAVYEKGRTVMHAIAQRGHYDLAVKYIEKMNFDVKDKDGYTPLHLAVEARQTRFVELLVQKGVEINAKSVSKNSTPLHIASEKGHLEIINILLSAPKVDTNLKDIFGFTPLHYAVKNGRRIVEALINKSGTDINIRSITGITPFHTALMIQDQQIIDLFLQRSRERGNIEELLNTKDEKNNTPLHYAILYHNYKIRNLSVIRSLLAQSELEVNTVSDESKSSPLQLALILKQSDVASQLIEDKRTDLNLKMENNVTPLHLAISKGMVTVALQLINRADVNRDESNYDGYTALHLAAMRPETEMIRALLQKGDKRVKNINPKNNYYLTPLHVAAEQGRLEAVQLLIENGAKTDIKTNEGEIFFYYAIRSGNLELIQYCVKKININDIETRRAYEKSIGYYAACDAIKYGQLDVYKYLERIIEKDLCNPVYTAALFGQLDLLRYFIENQHKSADGSIANPDSEPPIFAAVKNDHLKIVKYLIEERKVDINLVYKDRLLIHYALLFERGNALQYLVTKGINLNALDSDSNTLLHKALPKHHKMLKFLLEQNTIDINARNKHGDTALHNAAWHADDIKTIELLCNYKADTTIKNNNNKTPTDIVIHSGKKPVFCLASKRLRRKTGFMLQDLDNFLLAKYSHENNINKSRSTELQYGSQMSKSLSKNLQHDNQMRESYSKELQYDNHVNDSLRKEFKYDNHVTESHKKELKNDNHVNESHRKELQDYNHVNESPRKEFKYDNQISKFYTEKSLDGNKIIKSRGQELQYESHGEKHLHRNRINKSPLDLMGLLLLIDVFFKKWNKETYKFNGESQVSVRQSRAIALNITKRFEEFLNSSSKLIPSEHIDISKVYSDVLRAVISDNFNKIPGILRSYSKFLTDLNTAAFEQFLTDPMFETSTASLDKENI